MKKIYNAPEVMVDNIALVNVLCLSTTGDPADNGYDVLTKELPEAPAVDDIDF